jgi:hypothetical protein
MSTENSKCRTHEFTLARNLYGAEDFIFDPEIHDNSRVIYAVKLLETAKIALAYCYCDCILAFSPNNFKTTTYSNNRIKQ